MADPMASAEDIAWLQKDDPVAALQHPNCPPEVWWELAKKHPMEAEESILFSLMTLEDPLQWTEQLDAWIWRLAEQELTEAEGASFAADCAEHVLFIYKQKYPNDTTPQDAIATARAVARKEMTGGDAEKTGARCLRLAERRMHEDAVAASYAARAAAYAAYMADTMSFAAESAAEARRAAAAHPEEEAGLSPGRIYGWTAMGKSAEEAEQKWQWARLREYMSGAAKVGGRTHKSIQQNPQATEAAIRTMAKKQPKKAVAHPNCPEDLWWKLAEDHPIEALSNPAIELFLLATPERWEALERDFMGNWITRSSRQLSAQDKRLFAADCAERAIPIYELDKPKDESLQEAIEVARAFATGNATMSRLEEVRVDLAGMLRNTFANTPSNIAIKAIMFAICSPISLKFAAENAAGNASIAVSLAKGASADEAERRWQWLRLLQYLRGEVQP